MRFSLNILIAIVLSLYSVGCISKPAFLIGDDKELQDLIKSYKEANAQLQKSRENNLTKKIMKLAVEKTPDGYVVNVDLDHENRGTNLINLF